VARLLLSKRRAAGGGYARPPCSAARILQLASAVSACVPVACLTHCGDVSQCVWAASRASMHLPLTPENCIASPPVTARCHRTFTPSASSLANFVTNCHCFSPLCPESGISTSRTFPSYLQRRVHMSRTHPIRPCACCGHRTRDKCTTSGQY